MFKNRDRGKEEEKANIILKEPGIFAFSDKNMPGAWTGINKYGLGIVSSYGPSVEIPRPEEKQEHFGTNIYVLRECKELDEAVDCYIEHYKKSNVAHSTNILIGNVNRAVAIEAIGQNFATKKVDGNFYFKTNHFTLMEKYNTGKLALPQRIDDSKMRLEKLQSEVPKIDGIDNLKRILAFHSPKKPKEPLPELYFGNGSICRHFFVQTIASAIFDIRADHAEIHYILNDSPCHGNWQKEIFHF